MRITLNTKEFQAALKLLKGYIPKKPSLPILASVNLQTTDNNTAVLTVTDLDKQLSIRLNANISDAGAINIPLKNIDNILKLSAFDTEIISDEKTITFNSKRKYEIVNEITDDFPLISLKENLTHAITLPAAELTDKIKAKAMLSASDIKPLMTRFNLSGNKLIACDGFKLAQFELSESSNSIIDVSLTALEFISKAKTKDNIKIECNDKVNIYTFDNMEYIDRRFKGDYPDLERVVPKYFEGSFAVKKSDLLDTLEFAKGIVKDIGCHTVILDIKDNDLKFVAQSSKEKLIENIEIDNNSNSKIVIGFDCNYLIDIIKCLDDDPISINFNNSISAATITGSNDKELYLLLPVRIPENYDTNAA